MKHIFLFCVLLFSLLAVCNCKHDSSPSYENTNSETGQEKAVPQEDEAQEVVTSEDENQGVEAGENEKPVVTQEDETPKEGTQENETQETEEDGTKEVEEKENETQEIEGEEGENEEILPPEINEFNFAVLQINELRTEFSGLSQNEEYIEFKVVKSGSMEGLYLYSVMNNAQDIFVYIFPEIDVEAGEYITLHLRTFDKINSCDELRDDLTISEGVNSCPSARDLWVIGNTKLIDKNSIVYIQDVNGKIMDAVILNEKPVGTWNASQTHFAEIAERLFNAGIWQSVNENKPTSLDAVDTSAIGTNHYKSVSRYEGRENTHSAKDWYIAGYITPGQPNK
jgi:hypothetical protein